MPDARELEKDLCEEQGHDVASVSVQQAIDLHQALLSDPAFVWEAGGEGCFARAVLMVEHFLAEGVPPDCVGKLLVVSVLARTSGWRVATRLAGVQTWIQHVVPTLETNVGTRICDPTVGDAPEECETWLMRFPPEPLNPSAAPTLGYIQTLLNANDVVFRQLLTVAASRPEFHKHLLSDPRVATRLAKLGEPVRCWLEQSGPVAEDFTNHLRILPSLALSSGPLVRGEIVRVGHGIDFFNDVPWDLAGSGLRGAKQASAVLQTLRLNSP